MLAAASWNEEFPASRSDSDPLARIDLDARYREIRPVLAVYLRTILPDYHAVNDCLQETFLVLWKRYLDTTGDDLRRVALVCARNKAYDWLRSNKVGRLVMVDPNLLCEIAEAAVDHVDAARVEIEVEALRNCLSGLSAEQRELIGARYDGGMGTLVELALRWKRKMDAIYKQLERLRVTLKRCVKAKIRDNERP